MLRPLAQDKFYRVALALKRLDTPDLKDVGYLLAEPMLISSAYLITSCAILFKWIIHMLL